MQQRWWKASLSTLLLLSIFTVSVTAEFSDTDSGLTYCYFPSAENITATLTHFMNGSSYINVTWDQTKKPRVNHLLNYPIRYCYLSRRWFIRVLHFSSPDDVEDGDRRLEIGPGVPFEAITKRETHYRVPEDVDFNKYYLIQLKNHRRDNIGGDFIYRNYSSYIYYFGQQERVSYLTGSAAITVLIHKELTIDCHSRGIPTPSIKLIRHGNVLELPSGVYSIYRVEERHAGVYYCSSSNTVVYPLPRGKYKHTVNKAVTVQVTMPVNYTSEVSCKYYNAAMCRTYIHRSRKIAYNESSSQLRSLISSYDSQINVVASDLRTMLASGETTSKTAHITDELITKCFNFARAMDCHTIYPYCDASSTLRSPVPRPICNHSCTVFAEGGNCEFFLDPEVLPENSGLHFLKQLLLSKCDTRVNPAGTTPECFYVSFESPQIDSAEQINQTQCVKGDGRGYGGDIFYSETGTPCQAWFSQTPHQHSIQPEHFPVELFTAGFSCRNPGGLGERPWCYTTSEAVGKRWEYCDIPRCEVCEDYNMKFCSSLPGYNDTKVYINNEQGLNLSDIEHKMSGLYFPLIGPLSTGCQLALRQIICHTALPFCKTQSAPSPQKVCSEHCVLLNELRYCPENVLTELEKHWSGEASRTGKYYRPDCSISNGGDEECMPTPVRLQSTADKYTDCFNQTDSGQSYTGTVSVTILGEPCQPWIPSNRSANSTFTVDLFPELAEAENYCRNPGQLQYVPWCITNRTSQSFGLCDIDTCATMNTIDYIRDQLRCHPDCIRIRQDTNFCDTSCNSTAVHMDDYNDCDEERPCENDGRCAIVGDANIQRCVSLPDLNNECSDYDPVDDGTRGEDDEDREREMERYRDDFNEGAEDRFLARNLMESVNECGNDLRCSDQGICVMATGPCADMRRSNNDVDCDDDGNFDTRQCRRQQDDTYMCWCANPQEGRPDHSTTMIVNEEHDFSRSDCIRRIFRNCTVRRGGKSYQAIHGERIVMDTDTACRVCHCDNGTAAACQNIVSASCPTRNQERVCTHANGDIIANGERAKIGDGNMCGCKDGDLQCTRDTCRGGEDEEEDNDEMMCYMCASMAKKLVCGPNAITYPNRCSAMRYGGFTADEIFDGSCPNVPVCDLFPCRDGFTCVRIGGNSCTGRCEPNEVRRCVNRTALRCPSNTTIVGNDIVCSSNGRSYRSFCHMIKLGPPNVRVVHRGRCNSPDCAGGMVCGTDRVTYDSRCHLQTLSANARVDHMGACEEDTSGMMTWMQLCEKTKIDNKCPRTDCMSRVMPREGCCPICGGLTTIALDGMRMAEEKDTTGESYDIDDIMDKIQDSDLITDNVYLRCDVSAAFTTTTRQLNMEVAFEAKDVDSDHDYCKWASEEFAEKLNSDAVTLPAITNFVSAAVSAPLVVDDSGAPALTASCLAVMVTSIFAAASLFF